MAAKEAGGAAPVVCLMGQTAAGKTDIAVALARHLPLGIVSVDSAMVYRGMDIGTAKPAPEVLAAAPHRLIDIREPEDTYSAGDFRVDAMAAIEETRAAGKVPLLVGGTMLYFRALMRGLAPLPGRDPAVRAGIDARARRIGWPGVHAELARVDPESARRIDPRDSQRIQRALEVWELSGRSLTDWHRQDPDSEPPWRFLRLALVFRDRDVLRERIGRRLDGMVAAGLVEEVRGLLDRPGLSPAAPALRAVGYRQFVSHVLGECGLDEALRAARVATGRLAKRQHTWIRGEEDVECLDPLDPRTPDHISRRIQQLVERHGTPG